MGYETSASPGVYALGTQDNSQVPIPTEQIKSPVTSVLIYMLAEQGKSDLTYVPSGLAGLYGDKTFERGSAFYHHTNHLAETLAGVNIPLFVKRIKPEHAKTAMLRYSLEIIATDIPVYLRNPDGSTKKTLDPVTGNYIAALDKTIRGTIGVVHVGVENYDPDHRLFGKGIVVDDYRDGSTMVGGKFLGEITRADGSKEHSKSRLFPLFDAPVSSFGNFGNNIGMSIDVPSLLDTNSPDRDDVAKNRSFALRVKAHKRKDANSTPSPIVTIKSEQHQDLFLKPRAVSSVTNANISFGRNFSKAFQSKATSDAAPVWGPFDDIFVYDKNIQELQRILTEGYIYTDSNGSDVQVLGESAFDEEAADYGRSASQLLSDQLNNGYFNFLTGKDLNDVPYYSFSLANSTLFGGVQLGADSVHYASGGNDGLWYLPDGSPADLINLKILDDAVLQELNNFGNLDDKYRDGIRYPISTVIDSGYSMEVKMAFSAIIKNRPDIYMEIGTTSVAENSTETNDIGVVYMGNQLDREKVLSKELLNGWRYQGKLTKELEDARGNKLATYYRMIPESVYFGTKTYRVEIYGSCGVDVKRTYDATLPGSFDRGVAWAQFTGAKKWDPLNDPTTYEGRKPRFLTDMAYFYRESGEDDNSWGRGINYLKSADINDFIWPAYQTIYTDKSSVLSEPKFVRAATHCFQVGMRCWVETSGLELTDEQYKQVLKETAEKHLQGVFDESILVIVEPVLDDKDKARKYTGYLKFHIGAKNQRYKLRISVHGYDFDTLVQNQGLLGK